MPIIEIIKGKFSPEFISEIATQLGESESGISKAIGIFLPIILGKLSQNSSNNSVIDIVSGIKTNVLNNSQLEQSQHEPTNSLESILFDNGINNVLNLTSERSGISLESAKSVLNTITKSATTTIGDYIRKNNIEPKEISNLLEQQKFIVPSILPAGLSLDDVGLKDLIDQNLEENPVEILLNKEIIEVKTEKIKNIPPSSYKNEGGFWRWLLPLILLGLAAWFFWKLYEKQNIPDKINIEHRK